jgi:hypothetical protein
VTGRHIAHFNVSVVARDLSAKSYRKTDRAALNETD